MKPKLISFKLCPYVQKAILTLLHKGIDFDIEYIDLMDPPEWFKEISPLGKVLVL
jgi:glutathione S-transferase